MAAILILCATVSMCAAWHRLPQCLARVQCSVFDVGCSLFTVQCLVFAVFEMVAFLHFVVQ